MSSSCESVRLKLEKYSIDIGDIGTIIRTFPSEAFDTINVIQNRIGSLRIAIFHPRLRKEAVFYINVNDF